MIKLEQLITAIQEYYPQADFTLLKKAYNFVHLCHEGQMRESGKPYVTHVIEVALLTTKLKLDVSSVVAALLHDIVEDTKVTLEEIKEAYGSDVAGLVDGLTKLSNINFNSKVEQQAESFRKMLLAMARDIRVLLIKLCDRMHNIRTLEYTTKTKQLRIAQETLDIYAPLAHRLGIYWMKSELEDLCFKYLKPALYNSIKEQVNQTEKEREYYIKEVVREISQALKENGINGAIVFGRAKSYYSIYRKMEMHDYNFQDLYDLIGFRIIVSTTMECYSVLGIIHAKWKPMSDRFKDYIAMPKPNNYQSLHTSVVSLRGSRIEIQIRTKEMHDVAEKGIAAHWIYKETGSSNKVKLMHNTIDFNWLKDLLESEQLLHDPLEFMSLIKDTLFQVGEEVYVFSPKGDLVELPTGATPIDFAFYVHSEVGLHCKSARVNGQQVPISYKLKTGDTVEIITSPSQTPSRDWLRIVTSTKARQRIRQVLRSEEFSRTILVAKELLAKEARKLKINFAKVLKSDELLKIALEFGHKEVDSLLMDIGYTRISPKQIFDKLTLSAEELSNNKPEQELLEVNKPAITKTSSDDTGIKISGMDRVVFRFARCCEPLPGDEIVGFVTRGRGVAIHKKNCKQIMDFDTHRLIDVSWDTKLKLTRNMYIRIITTNEIGVLVAITQCIASFNINVLSAKSNPMPNNKMLNLFKITLENNTQAGSLLNAIEKLNGVITVERGGRIK
ncbi:MAG: bifunctional (p)ppGpp synthetase/guanosine-3',5'-bis(diphosphate) 3'-pyrophosphohydrolase [Deltaproteobacteria bacterium]|jgi:GTP pyrophosphokinase|nr:bifunctional (p)ppGpp synthetase/guanosine-3',5'-bis(diphosphate) 3'-pyrophosphohydrolase [Deltaproteobacteria bacterium]